MIGVCSDITERRQQEEYLRQSQKMESLGILAGGIAHDFNNLLLGIMGNASLALEKLPQESSVRGLLDEVNKASLRAGALTKQLLAYAGKARFFTELVSPADLIREIIALVRLATPQKVSFDMNLQEDLPSIEVEASQIHQVILNLVVNAVEAIGQQIGCVSITTELQALTPEEIRARSPRLRPGAYVAITVQDTGCGMDEATMSRIFDPFFTTKFSGRGLGLAAVLGIVSGHQGTLRVVSTPGKGSAFTILLPPAVGMPPAAAEEELPPPGEGTILIVDDEAMVREMAKAALEHYGYRVLAASDGVDAVRVFREDGDRISLVLLDLTMPRMDGDEALNQLQQIRPEVPVVLTTGCSEADASSRFAGRKLAGILQKPYTASALARKLGSVLHIPPSKRSP
jgi:two-component system, cell cycle sensor histidine kinase and response regulator CckA